MAFCTNCGKSIAGRFCSHCGTAQQQLQYQQPQYQQSQHQLQPLNPARNVKDNRILLNTNDEINETIDLFGKRVRVSITVRTIAIVLSVFFFLPYFTATFKYFWSGQRLSEQSTFVTYEFLTELQFLGFSGVIGGRPIILNGSIFALLLILIPVALFAIYNFYRYLQFVKGNLFVVSIILSIAGLLINILYAIIITSSVVGIATGLPQQSGSVSSISFTHHFSFWFFLAIILYVLCSIISYKYIKKK